MFLRKISSRLSGIVDVSPSVIAVATEPSSPPISDCSFAESFCEKIVSPVKNPGDFSDVVI